MSKPAGTLAYRPFRPVSPVFRAVAATNFAAKPKSKGARAEGAPTGGGRADQRAGLMPLTKATESRKWKAVMLGALPPARSAIQQAACPA